jgi:heme oxygenase
MEPDDGDEPSGRRYAGTLSPPEKGFLRSMRYGENMTESESIHETLRAATRASHEALDASFGSLDMRDEGDFQRFLAAHFIGLAPLFPHYRAFVTEELAFPAPDFPGMLHSDLAANGMSAAALPAVTQQQQPASAAGIAYVLAGSRLGLAMIRKRGYWGSEAGRTSAYMEDSEGIAVWRGLTAWMAAQTPTLEEREAMCTSATQAFDVFREAFALSQAVGAR